MTDKELLEWALAALDGYARNCGGGTCDAAEALRVRLARAEEPDWAAAGFSKPPVRSEQWWKHEVSNAFAQGYEKGRLQREWQGLTDEEIEALDCTTINASDWNEYEVYKPSVQEFARAIEAKLKEKNA